MPKLTAAGVRSAKPGSHSDGNGLILRVWLTGGKRWVWRGTVQGRRRDYGLGSYPTVSLKEARTKALEYLRIARLGGDPSVPRSQVPTLQQAAEKVIQLHRAKWKPGGRSEEQWRSSLANYVFPRFGNKPVSNVTTQDVMACLAPIWYSRSTTARRTLQRISAIMRWSIAQAYRADNPADDRITAALGKNTKRPQHLKSVHHSRVAAAIAKIRESTAHPMIRLATEFAILTATRSGEARGARWSEMKLDDQLWEIPAERMKGDRQHRVPLSKEALAVLLEASTFQDKTGLVFPGKNASGLAAWQLSKLVSSLDLGGTLHGFRTSFRMWAAETGAAREVAEACLAHQVGDATERAYARSDLLQQRRQLLEKWGAYVNTLGI